jgi:sorbitol-specific phosphotransferase system component IIA
VTGSRFSVTALILIVAVSLPIGVAHGRSLRAHAKRVAAPARLARVRYIDHGLAVQPPKKRLQKGKVNQSLFAQYVLRTMAQQRASIAFQDGSALLMNQRTDAVLRSPSVTYVNKGEVQQIVMPGTKHQVKTNSAVASAIGTNFDINVTSAGTVITVVSGVVKVKNAQGSVQLTKNQQTTVAPGKAPAPPVAVNAPALVGWSAGLPAPPGNLVVNGDAEQAAGAADDTSRVAVPGWKTTGSFTAVQYGKDTFPASTDFGPADRGKNLFAGGPGSAVSTATQTIDVSRFGPGIDAGGWIMYTSAWLGGQGTKGDSATLTITAQSASHQNLAQITLGPATESSRSGSTGLVEWSGHVHTPQHTRSISVVLTMTPASGTYNDGFADDVSVLLSSP